jgi:hypothetical protein
MHLMWTFSAGGQFDLCGARHSSSERRRRVRYSLLCCTKPILCDVVVIFYSYDDVDVLAVNFSNSVTTSPSMFCLLLCSEF